jgi:methanethiol S-methyltransferase
MTIIVERRHRAIGRSALGSLAELLSIGYGAAVYAIFVVTLLYAVGFVSGAIVPKSIDTGTIWPPSVALCIDLQLLGLFVAQHSGMVRRRFKRVLTAYVPPLVERATYVLCASLVLILLFALPGLS